jgi:hypothetical protein
MEISNHSDNTGGIINDSNNRSTFVNNSVMNRNFNKKPQNLSGMRVWLMASLIVLYVFLGFLL